MHPRFRQVPPRRPFSSIAILSPWEASGPAIFNPAPEPMMMTSNLRSMRNSFEGIDLVIWIPIPTRPFGRLDSLLCYGFLDKCPTRGLPFGRHHSVELGTQQEVHQLTFHASWDDFGIYSQQRFAVPVLCEPEFICHVDAHKVRLPRPVLV